MALEIAGDVVLGSSPDPEPEIDVNLANWQGEERGVSQRHVLLRPSREKLFILDLGSTNATHLNGALLTTERVQALQTGDLLTLGRLHLRVQQVERVD
jgi:pSer/pThr/pTyr-binding forkhead associated (FHA) protein